MTSTDALRALRDAVKAGELEAVNKSLGKMFSDDHTLPWSVVSDINSAFRGSLDAALALHKAVLPGWGWAAGECHVSDDARVFPDFYCPEHGERLRATVREDADWFSITDVDQRPPGNPARALLLAILSALIAAAETGPEKEG